MIFLEAPQVDVQAGAILAANGGGAGSAGFSTISGGAPGTAGKDGALNDVPALGGPSVDAANSGAGGKGAAGSTAAESGVKSTYGGGGGGGAGRIWLRTRGTPATLNGVISPGPMRDTNL
jgi:hypothetical protein